MEEPIITIDIDWAPDWIVDEVACMLLEKKVRATWYVTHQSPAITRLADRHDLFELGIHPNLFPGSSHGNNERAVLTFVKDLVPNAVSMRTHGLYQSTRFLDLAASSFGITHDVSLFLPHCQNLAAHQLRLAGSQLTRLPYFWEDDIEAFALEPIWSCADTRLAHPGLRIFDFHPIHIALNTVDFSHYERLKSKTSVQTFSRELIERERHVGPGPRSMCTESTTLLAGRGRWIQEIKP